MRWNIYEVVYFVTLRQGVPEPFNFKTEAIYKWLPTWGMRGSKIWGETTVAEDEGQDVRVRAKVQTFLGRRTWVFPLSILHVAQFLYLGDSNCEVTRLPAEPRPKSCASFLESTRRNLSPLRGRMKNHHMIHTHFQVNNICQFNETFLYLSI